jgi:hypothetical protein
VAWEATAGVNGVRSRPETLRERLAPENAGEGFGSFQTLLIAKTTERF